MMKMIVLFTAENNSNNLMKLRLTKIYFKVIPLKLGFINRILIKKLQTELKIKKCLILMKVKMALFRLETKILFNKKFKIEINITRYQESTQN